MKRHTEKRLSAYQGQHIAWLTRASMPCSEDNSDFPVAFTMDSYSHIIDGMQQDAMALLDEVMPAGVARGHNANSTPTLVN